jgi:hypothetical protein
MIYGPNIFWPFPPSIRILAKRINYTLGVGPGISFFWSFPRPLDIGNWQKREEGKDGSEICGEWPQILDFFDIINLGNLWKNL